MVDWISASAGIVTSLLLDLVQTIAQEFEIVATQMRFFYEMPFRAAARYKRARSPLAYAASRWIMAEHGSHSSSIGF
ncbi:MAG: hypothetical protein ACTHM2_11480 [Afipia sp.]